MMNKPSFRVWFNGGKQYFDVYVADNARKFMALEKCYAYYYPAENRKTRKGRFGSIHLSRVGGGIAAHELLHLWIDWLKCRKMTINDQNEEKLVLLFDEMTRKFWINYYKWKGEEIK